VGVEAEVAAKPIYTWMRFESLLAHWHWGNRIPGSWFEGPKGLIGGFLVRILVLVEAPRGRTGPFFSPPWPWWAPGGTSHQVGWSGEARGSRGGAPGGAALTFAPGRAAGGVFFQIKRARRARLGPAKIKKNNPPCV
jgi:hypothetical protein